MVNDVPPKAKILWFNLKDNVVEFTISNEGDEDGDLFARIVNLDTGEKAYQRVYRNIKAGTGWARDKVELEPGRYRLEAGHVVYPPAPPGPRICRSLITRIGDVEIVKKYYCKTLEDIGFFAVWPDGFEIELDKIIPVVYDVKPATHYPYVWLYCRWDDGKGHRLEFKTMHNGLTLLMWFEEKPEGYTCKVVYPEMGGVVWAIRLPKEMKSKIEEALKSY